VVGRARNRSGVGLLSSPVPYSDADFGQLSKYCRKVFELVTEAKQALGLADVFYGDQNKIPRTPAACIVPDVKRRELKGAPRGVENILSTYILVYVSKVDDVQKNEESAIVIGEAIETYLHQFRDLQGLVVHCYCSAIEPGYRTREGTQFRAVRLTFEGLSKTILNGGQ
jgi:hypothetical protein